MSSSRPAEVKRNESDDEGDENEVDQQGKSKIDLVATMEGGAGWIFC